VDSVVQNRVADAGFLVALWNRRDRHHAWAIAIAKAHPPPWIVCEAAFADVDHLLNNSARRALHIAVGRGALQLVSLVTTESTAVFALQEKYADVPMSIADASIVRLTEILPDPLVLTTDADFKIYRRHGRRVVPSLLP
jgi:predicted nucleic acid-binding protein